MHKTMGRFFRWWKKTMKVASLEVRMNHQKQIKRKCLSKRSSSFSGSHCQVKKGAGVWSIGLIKWKNYIWWCCFFPVVRIRGCPYIWSFHVAYMTECIHFRYLLRSVSTRKKLVSNGHLPLGVEHQKGARVFETSTWIGIDKINYPPGN